MTHLSPPISGNLPSIKTVLLTDGNIVLVAGAQTTEGIAGCKSTGVTGDAIPPSI